MDILFRAWLMRLPAVMLIHVSLLVVALFCSVQFAYGAERSVQMDVNVAVDDICYFGSSETASVPNSNYDLGSLENGLVLDQVVVSIDYYCNRAWSAGFGTTEFLLKHEKYGTIADGTSFSKEIGFTSRMDVYSESATRIYTCSSDSGGTVPGCSSNTALDPATSNIPVKGQVKVSVKLDLNAATGTDSASGDDVSDYFAGEYGGILRIEMGSIVL